MGYYVQFQGYCYFPTFFFTNTQIQSRNTININKKSFQVFTKEEKLYVLSQPGPLDRV